jgi:nucleoside-diphosphate-sugar epimerase
MRVLFLGGTSLTGPYAVRRLHALGHQVTVFHRGEHEADFPSGVQHIHGALADSARELLDAAPDVVVHMWAMTEADAESFIRQFRGGAGRAVVISSGDVYRAYGRLQRIEPGPPDAVPLREDSPLRESRYPYRQTAPHYDKLLVEQALAGQTDLPATILRFPAVLGPGEYRRFHRWVQPMLRGDGELKIQDEGADWRWTHGFAEDVAESVVLAATIPAATGRTYNVGEARTPTMIERLREFARATNWRGRILPVPASELPEVNRLPHDFAHHIECDTGRIRAQLGYREVVPHEESLARTLEFERQA